MLESNPGLILSNAWLLFPVGVYAAVRIALSLMLSFNYFWNAHITLLFKNRTPLKKRFGEWAVVTGCTAGIGEQFAYELASQGMNVVLISRSLDKLTKLSDEIEKQYGVKTKVIVSNYLDRDAYKGVQKGTEGMDIGILVNNVGLNTDTGSRRFDEMTVEAVRNMIIVNSGAATIMNKVFLPGMMSRGRGCSLSIGSTSGYIPFPYQAVYCGTKSYLRALYRATDEEIKGSGVILRNNNTQFVRTNMCKGNDFIYNFPIWTIDPRDYARSSLRTLDTPDSGGYIVYDFMLWFTDAGVTTLGGNVVNSGLYELLTWLLPHCSRVED